MGNWTFITTHGAVFMFVARNPQVTALEIATKLGITERSVRRVIKDLETEGYITKRRRGRINQYKVNLNARLRRSENKHLKARDLLKVLL